MASDVNVADPGFVAGFVRFGLLPLPSDAFRCLPVEDPGSGPVWFFVVHKTGAAARLLSTLGASWTQRSSSMARRRNASQGSNNMK